MLVFANTTMAQTANIWCFGDSAGINFNGSLPNAITTCQTSTLEICASISDSDGNLLFYAGAIDPGSGYINVWNNNHVVMQDGDSILSHSSYTNGAIILPLPGSNSQYYLFYITPILSKINYAIIDMSYNGNQGAVTQRDITFFNDTVTEKLTAVRHANGRDWWLLAHLGNNYFSPTASNNTFVKFLVTPNGISGPIFQSIGTILTGDAGRIGEMVFSNAGNKLALCGNYSSNKLLDLFDFDRCSGELSNWQNLGSPQTIQDWYYYGCSFSPSDNRLYVSSIYALEQFDLLAPNIFASKTTLWNSPNLLSEIGQHQIASDGKIYITHGYGNAFPNNFFDSLNLHISVINDPNNLGASCNFAPYSFYLGGRRAFYSLPNFPNYNLGKIPESPCDTIPNKIIIPNVFTPNGDGINDAFIISGSGIENINCTIYNRWGIKVASLSRAGEQWDGRTTSGQAAAEGVYYYMLQGRSGDGNDIAQTGFVQLLR